LAEEFGIREFDDDMYKQEVFDHCEEDRKGEISKRRAEAMVHCSGYDEVAFLTAEV
jgi:hypothetical protein